MIATNLQMNNRQKCILIVIALLFLLFLIAGFITIFTKSQFNKSTWNGDKVIGSNFGIVGDYTDTNSLEAYEEAYERGLRTFEVNLTFTSDNKLVLRRNWKKKDKMQEGIDKKHIPTLEQFLATPLYGEYTPLAFTDLLDKMEQYPDIWIVVRFSVKDEDAFRTYIESMINEAKEYGKESLLSRLIIRTQDTDWKEFADSVYSFSYYLFDITDLWDGTDKELFRKLCKWCREKGIQGIIVNSVCSEVEDVNIAMEYHIDLYMDEINTKGVAQTHIDEGYRGCFVNSVSSKDIYSPAQDGPIRWLPYTHR